MQPNYSLKNAKSPQTILFSMLVAEVGGATSSWQSSMVAE